MKHLRLTSTLIIAGLALTGLTSCNLYGGIDSPSGDLQLLSAARAAFDQGEFDKATKYYGQLSGNYNDVRLAEEAEVQLNQAGATIQNFAAAFGNGKDIVIGTALANFATSLKPFAGSANRQLVFTAYSNFKTIQDPNLKSLIQFLGSMAMAGLVLAEDIQPGDSTYLKKDVCPPTGTPVCSSGVLAAGSTVSGGGSMNAAAASDFSGTATLSMFNAAMIDVLSSVQAIGTGGNLGSSAQSLAATLTGNPATWPAAAGDTNYRAAMINVGIGL